MVVCHNVSKPKSNRNVTSIEFACFLEYLNLYWSCALDNHLSGFQFVHIALPGETSVLLPPLVEYRLFLEELVARLEVKVSGHVGNGN